MTCLYCPGGAGDRATATIPKSSFPWAMGCWVKPVATTDAAKTFFGAFGSGSTVQFISVGSNPAATLRLRRNDNTTVTTNDLGSAVGAGAWRGILLEAISATDVEVRTSTGLSMTATLSRAPSLNSISIGADGGSSGLNRTNGYFDEAAFWGAALSDDQRNAFLQGVPATDMPANLLAYWPRLGVLSGGGVSNDVVGGFHFTAVGAIVAAEDGMPLATHEAAVLPSTAIETVISGAAAGRVPLRTSRRFQHMMVR